MTAWICARRSSVSIPRPITDWFVTTTVAKPASRNRRNATPRAGDEAHVGRVGQMVDELDQRPVPVEEDGGSHVAAPNRRGASALAAASASWLPMSRW
jgi:hypothetical protein